MTTFLLLCAGLLSLAPMLGRPVGGRWGRYLVVMLAAALAVCVLGRLANQAVAASFGTMRQWDISIATAAAAWMHGQPLYPAPEQGLYYGLLYGPLLYEVIALGGHLFGIGTSLAALPLFLIEAAAVVMTGIALRRLGLSRPMALVGMGLAVLCLSLYYPSVGFRAEPLLLLLSALALTSLPGLRRGDYRAGLLLGVSAGLAAAVKISGASYMGPVLIAGLLSGRQTWRVLPAVLAGAAAGFLLPYQVDGIGLASHLHFLDGLYPFNIYGIQIVGNLLFLTSLILPILAWGPGRDSDRPLVIGLIVSAIPILVVASIEGAWTWHFLPFLPPYLLLAGHRLSGTSPDNLRRVLLVATTLMVTVSAIKGNLLEIRRILQDAPRFEQTWAGVAAFLRAHPGATVAIGDALEPDKSKSPLQWGIARLAAAGQPVFFTTFAWTDMRRTENVDRLIAKTFDGCRVQYWLTGTEAAFVADRMDPRIPAAFHQRYERDSGTDHFTVWRCRPHPEGPAASP